MRDAGASSDWRSAGPPAGDRLAPDPPPAPRRGRWAAGGTLAVSVLLAALIAVLVFDAPSSPRPPLSSAAINSIVDQRVKAAISQLEAQPSVAARVYRQALAGLVMVRSSAHGSSPSAELGSGTLIDGRGDILTALHLIQGVPRIEVTFGDGLTSAASILATDPVHDIAVLTTVQAPSRLMPEVIGSGPGVGDQVFALGDPLDLVGSLSAGVVSGLDRSTRLPDGHTLSGLIQFDAAVNPGSTGGPLLDTQGQVIGVVAGLASPTSGGGFAGIGFAIPIGDAGQAAGAPEK
jgi:S1-C subfamily serine protease